MFLCKKCHDKEGRHSWLGHFVFSFGRCEGCGKRTECADCKL